MLFDLVLSIRRDDAFRGFHRGEFGVEVPSVSIVLYFWSKGRHDLLLF
jgi:hypothetical protein